MDQQCLVEYQIRSIGDRGAWVVSRHRTPNGQLELREPIWLSDHALRRLGWIEGSAMNRQESSSNRPSRRPHVSMWRIRFLKETDGLLKDLYNLGQLYL